MPTIEITENDFLRLQRYAEPLVDTASTAFTKALNKLEGVAYEHREPDVLVLNSVVYRPENLPPLRFAKFLGGRFGERIPNKNSWDSMVRLALTFAYERLIDVQKVRSISGANIVPGKKEDEGYKYLDEVDFSFQGVSAEDGVEIIIRCARALGCKISIDFVWRNNEAAHRPGVSGRVEA